MVSSVNITLVGKIRDNEFADHVRELGYQNLFMSTGVRGLDVV